MTPFSIWIFSGIVFLIIEFTTAAFYGLSLSLASFIVAVYLLAYPTASIDWIQGLIFAISSLFFAFLLPYLFRSKNTDKPQGLDVYIGKKATLKHVWDDLKITLDGVSYLIESDDELKAHDRVEILSHTGVTFHVKKV